MRLYLQPVKQWRGTPLPVPEETGAAVPYSGNPNLNASREPGYNFKVMKKFILCLLAVAAGMSAFGQGRVIGVRAGLNVTSIDLSAGSNSFSFDSRASYNVGFAYQQPLLRALPLYLETGLYLTGRGGAVNVADFGFGFDEELSGKVKFNMLYLAGARRGQLAFQRQERFDTAPGGCLLWVRYPWQGEVQGREGRPVQVHRPGGWRRGGSDVQTLRPGPRFGVNVTFRKHYNVSLGYDLGLLNILKDADEVKAKNGSFFVSLGYNF